LRLLTLEAPLPEEAVEDCFAASCEGVPEFLVAGACGSLVGLAVNDAATASTRIPIIGIIFTKTI
jgi:hypothetical protein